MDLLDIGCAFDWITPSIAFVQDFIEGSHADFGIPTGAASRGDIRRLLNRHGIRVWGLMYNLSGDMMMFTVPNTQARFAYYVLQRQGVPVLYAPEAATTTPQAIPVASDDSSDFMDRFFNF